MRGSRGVVSRDDLRERGAERQGSKTAPPRAEGRYQGDREPMTEYAYYGLNIGPGEDGPIWRFMDDFETGVYLRRHTTEPAVVGRSEVSQYKGYRRFHDVEVPLWARPPGEASVRITPDI